MVSLVGDIHGEQKDDDDGDGYQNWIEKNPAKATLYGLGRIINAEGEGEHEVFVADDVPDHVIRVSWYVFFRAPCFLPCSRPGAYGP